MANRYNYEELRSKALSPNALQSDIEALYNWLWDYDPQAWNGSFFDIGNGLGLFPLYTETEPDEWEITGYEIRRF